jgi:hypothetical protein
MSARTLPPEQEPPAADGELQADVSRRSVLRGAAGAAGAGIAASSLIGALAGPAVAGQSRAARQHDGRQHQDVVVHMRDSRSGEMDIFSGTSHTRVRDRELAARLVGEIS